MKIIIDTEKVEVETIPANDRERNMTNEDLLSELTSVFVTQVAVCISLMKKPHRERMRALRYSFKVCKELVKDLESKMY